MKKYKCMGGWVTSRSDSDRHFISAQRVAELYKVNPAECIFINPEDHPSYDKLKGYDANTLLKLRELWPKDNGDYTL